MNILSPSLLSIDFNHIERNAKVLDEAGVKWFHLDVRHADSTLRGM